MTTPFPEMDQEHTDLGTLFERVRSGETLVTANSRLSKVLTGQYNQWRMAGGDRQWRTPRIFSWDIWLHGLWEQAGLNGVEEACRAVPGAQQLTNLWDRVLREERRPLALLQSHSLAQQLRDTRRLVVEWKLDLDHPAWRSAANENCAAFRTWNRAFEALCRRQGWIAPEDRAAIVARAFRSSHLYAPARFCLLGFDEFNPVQADVLQAIAGSGGAFSRETITPCEAVADLWESWSEQEELEVMARWVRHWREREPDSSIAVIVHDLQRRRGEIERSLHDLLTPGAGPGSDKPWNVSMGIPLARVPVISGAFDLLRLLEERIDIQDAGRVLRSPWISGGESERGSRALLEKCLRDNYPRQLKLSEIRYRATQVRKHDGEGKELPEEDQGPRAWNSPVLADLVTVLERFKRESRGRRPASAWAESLDQLLGRLGWPGRGSTDYGGQSRVWQDALRELASLDATLPALDRTAAIRQLEQICRERIYQPGTPPASIQVLGLYEASGLQFDHLWVLGLHGDNWPPVAHPNPFIPGILQQQAQLPHSSPQRELEVAKTVTARLLGAGRDCVFSYTGQSEGEAVLPSPLLGNGATRRIDSVPGWAGDTWAAVIRSAGPPTLERLRMPGPLERDTARGGSSILKHQALCPFRAFASNRLGAEALETPVDGISAMLHGSLFHRVLEKFWKETRTQDALIQLDDARLEQRIQDIVGQVVAEERSLRDRGQFRGVESRRLARLAMNHLELEKTRGPFEVAEYEKELREEIEGQVVRLVIDRIDRLPSGEQVIIDYKTGRVDPKMWFGNRPEDPQLPLYAISADFTPAAVVFAVVRDDECHYRGVTAREDIFPDLPPQRGAQSEDIRKAGEAMPETIADWRRTLHRLMADFLAGEAAVDPRDGRETCKNSYCTLQSLCRLEELEHIRGEAPA